jgi:hypothetical protein
VEIVRISSGTVEKVRESSEKSKKNSIESDEFESQRTSTKGEEGRRSCKKLGQKKVGEVRGSSKKAEKELDRVRRV